MGGGELKRGELLGRVIRASVQLQASLEASLHVSRLGLTPLGVEVVRLLLERGPSTRASLARALGIQPQTLGRVLGQLSRRRLIEKDVVAQRREVFLTVTPAGLSRFRAALVIMEEQQELWFKGVPAAERALVQSIIEFGAEGVQWEATRRWHPLYLGVRL